MSLTVWTYPLLYWCSHNKNGHTVSRSGGFNRDQASCSIMGDLGTRLEISLMQIQGEKKNRKDEGSRGRIWYVSSLLVYSLLQTLSFSWPPWSKVVTPTLSTTAFWLLFSSHHLWECVFYWWLHLIGLESNRIVNLWVIQIPRKYPATSTTF